jgi:hypothetical protein
VDSNTAGRFRQARGREKNIASARRKEYKGAEAKPYLFMNFPARRSSLSRKCI